MPLSFFFPLSFVYMKPLNKGHLGDIECVLYLKYTLVIGQPLFGESFSEVLLYMFLICSLLRTCCSSGSNPFNRPVQMAWLLHHNLLLPTGGGYHGVVQGEERRCTEEGRSCATQNPPHTSLCIPTLQNEKALKCKPSANCECDHIWDALCSAVRFQPCAYNNYFPQRVIAK